MTFNEDLTTYLNSVGALTAIVDNKIMPAAKEQLVEAPCVVYQRIDAERSYTHDGDAWIKARYQFTCWGSDALECEQVVEAMVGAVSGLTAAMGARNVTCLVDNEADDFEPTTQLYRRHVDAFLSYAG